MYFSYVKWEPDKSHVCHWNFLLRTKLSRERKLYILKYNQTKYKKK